MRFVTVFFMCIILSAIVSPVTTVIPTDHLKPFRIRVDGDRIVIGEEHRISVYTKSGFRLISRFGKAGEGPGEFKLRPEFSPELDLGSGKILATSMGKITLLTDDGVFLSEKSTTELGFSELIRFFGDRYVGSMLKSENKKIWNVINIYDRDLKNPITIFRFPFHMERDGKFNPVTRGIYLPNYYITGKTIWVGGELYKDTILAFDDHGRRQFELVPEIPRTEFTEKDKKGFIDSYLSRADYRQEYERLKNRFLYPDDFPLWQNFIAGENRIYLQTFARNDSAGKNEFYIYDTRGKLVDIVWLPLTEYWDFTPEPYFIYEDTLYQLSNNYESEIIELRITPIKR